MSLTTRITKLRKQNPLLSNEKIAEKVRCSRQYVHRVLKKTDLPNPPRKKKVRLCEVCKKESTAKVHKGRCSYEYYRPEIVCSFCKVKFRRTLYQLLDKDMLEVLLTSTVVGNVIIKVVLIKLAHGQNDYTN